MSAAPSTVDPPAVADTGPEAKQPRLSINVNTAAVEFLDKLKSRGISYTETIRRALAVYKLVLTETEAGHRIQIDDGEKIRELVFF